MSSKQYTDKQLLAGIRDNDEKVLTDMYRRYFGQIKALIMTNNGTLEDARDVFQEAMLAVFLKVNDPAFELKTAFMGYLYSICKNIWLYRLRDKRNGLIRSNTVNMDSIPDEPYDDEEEYEKLLHQKLYLDNFIKLSEKCRKILEMRMGNYNYEQIASELNVSYASVRKMRYDCFHKFVNLIRNDPDYKRIEP